MSLLCAWAHVEDSAREQYASHVASVAARLDTRAWHFETLDTPFFEFEGTTQGNILTIFEIPKERESTEPWYPLSELTTGAPEHVRIDTRRYVEKMVLRGKHYTQDFVGGLLVAITFNLKDEATSELYYDFNRNDFGPYMTKIDEFLQGRYLEVTHADSIENGAPVQPEVTKNCQVFYDVEGHEWMWDAFMEVSDSDKWRVFESTLQLEIRWLSLVKTFPDDGKVAQAAATKVDARDSNQNSENDSEDE